MFIVCYNILVNGPAFLLTLKLLREPMMHKPDYIISILFFRYTAIYLVCFTRGLVHNLIPGRTSQTLSSFLSNECPWTQRNIIEYKIVHIFHAVEYHVITNSI